MDRLIDAVRVKVLLVDDRPENLYSLNSLLSDLHIDIISARSGHEALHLLVEHDIALALLDVQMPEMDGFELAGLMRGVEKTKDVPIIFLTAAAHRTNFEFKGYETGAVDFLFKPLDPHVLRTKVGVFVQLAKQKQLLATKLAELEVARQEAEVARINAERADRLKSSFLANMSHEIRTPLGALMGFAELLQRQDLDAEARAPYLEIILKNSRNLLALINEILDLSKVESGHLDIERLALPVRETLDEMLLLLNPLIQKNEIKVDLRIQPEVPGHIETDPLRFRQILTNVVGNAVKFSPRGRVQIDVSYKPLSEKNVHELQIQITDTGIGMSPEHVRSLFQPFSQGDAGVTRKFGGTGLGLALARKLTQHLGGDIELQRSEIGKGSSFMIRLEDRPSLRQTQLQKPRPSENGDENQITLQGLRILVVDDSEDNQLLIKTVLEMSGAIVQLADDGLQGIDEALKNEFDLILMDYQLPGCDGLEATRILRGRGLRVPIVALTANAMKDEKEKALSAGCDDYHSKPIHWDILKRMIQRLTRPSSSKAR